MPKPQSPDSRFESYDPIRALGPGLSCIDGDWKDSPFRRRMTVFALSSGELVLHSPIRLREQTLSELTRLGRIATIVVPNSLHGSEAPWYAERFPEARVLVPAAAASSLSHQMKISGTLESDWPDSYSRELACIPLKGTRVHEAAFVHAPSRTLVLTDAVFNMGNVFSGLEARVMRWNGIVGRFAMSRIFRWLVVADRRSFGRSVQSILEHDFDRVIMNHGQILDRGGKESVRTAFAAVLP